MKKSHILIIAAILFAGCTQKDANINTTKNQTLAYTQKFEYINSAQNDRFIVLATYLNPVYPDIMSKNNEEHIAFCIFPPDTTIKTSTLNINGDLNTTFKELGEDDERRKMIAFAMEWGKCYEAITPEKLTQNLNLKFTVLRGNSHQVPVSLSFRKISKSMYWNPRPLGK